MIRHYRDKYPVIHESVFLAENCTVIGEVTLEKDVNIWYNTVLRADEAPISIGENTNIQDNSTVHTCPKFPCSIGKNVTVGHNAIVHGCTVGDDCMIGMGAIVLNGAVIGKGSLVAAGAVIKEGDVIPEYSLCVGVPAKVVRTIDEAQRKKILNNAAMYVGLGQEYKD